MAGTPAGSGRPARYASSCGRTVTPSRSWVAAVAIACDDVGARQLAAVCGELVLAAGRPAAPSGRSGRSRTGRRRRRTAGAGLLFQLTKNPCAGLISCTCCDAGRKPCHSALPVPQVGQVRVDVRGPDRVEAADEVAGVAVVDVEPVEGVVDLRRALHPAADVVGERGLAPAQEADDRVDVVVVGGALVDHRDRLRRPRWSSPARRRAGSGRCRA